MTDLERIRAMKVPVCVRCGRRIRTAGTVCRECADSGCPPEFESSPDREIADEASVEAGAGDGPSLSGNAP